MSETIEKLIEEMAQNGGAITTTDCMTPIEINLARSMGRLHVREDGIGVALRSPQWVEMVKDGMAIRLIDAIRQDDPGSMNLIMRISALEEALNDCISSFRSDGKTTMVSEERLEAWQNILNDDDT